MGNALPDVCVVVLNWNGREHLPDLLPSLLRAKKAYGGACRIVVLDNPGPADDLAWVRENFPDIEGVRAPKNDYLFSYNWFLPQVSERIVVLLNNDLKVDENFLKPLVRPFEDSSMFSTSAKSLSWDGQEVTSAAFRACSHHGWYYWDNFESDKTVETLFAVGGFMALDRLKFLEIGGFDRLFFPAYGEDVDLCIRAKNQGWESIYVPESVVLHKEGASWKNDGSSKRYGVSTKTHLLVQWRHFGGIRNEFWRTLYIIHEILRGRKNIHFMKAWFAAKWQWIKRHRKCEIY